MRIEKFPRVNLAALTTLRVLLAETRGEGAVEGLAPPKMPDSGAGWLSQDESRGDA